MKSSGYESKWRQEESTLCILEVDDRWLTVQSSRYLISGCFTAPRVASVAAQPDNTSSNLL